VAHVAANASSPVLMSITRRGVAPNAPVEGSSAVLAASVAFFLAELGDKTMLATITLATQYQGWGGVVGVWAGSTVGMVVADGLAILAGRLLERRLPERAVRIGAAVLFVALGIWLAVEALLAR
jgi:putative Ca2+/H+ antiporter (TMEM165/GDT1 family)